MKLNHLLIFMIALAIIFSGCDRRANPTGRTRPTASFGVDLTIIKDYSTRINQADIIFKRENVLFSDAIIKVAEITIPAVDSGHYFLQGLILPRSATTVSFSSADDNYFKSISITLPDSFGIVGVNPPTSYGSNFVDVEWSEPSNGANHYIMSVVAEHYPDNGSVPYSALLGNVTTDTIPPEVFENPNSFNTIPDKYFIYVVAYNQGFGDFQGRQFPLPAGVTGQTNSEPAGILKYGTIAPVDSVRIF
jgi:hypothetical protein